MSIFSSYIGEHESEQHLILKHQAVLRFRRLCVGSGYPLVQAGCVPEVLEKFSRSCIGDSANGAEGSGFGVRAGISPEPLTQ